MNAGDDAVNTFSVKLYDLNNIIPLCNEKVNINGCVVK